MQNERWLLPEGIDELLPQGAETVERLRRRLLDSYHAWGYELVIPPFIEFIDSLLTGTGSDLDLQTFKLTDQLTGRMMGVRADITPQVARIDARKVKVDTPSRLCYIGTVLRTRPDSFGGTRSPLLVGAELFGHDGVASDAEVLLLMLETLRIAGLSRLHFDLGHVGIFRGLVQQAGIDRKQELQLFDALQRKAVPEIGQLVETMGLKSSVADMLLSLAQLNGGASVLGRAREQLAAASRDVHAAIDYVEKVAESVEARAPDASIHFDLAELRSYHYKTGIVFAAFAPGCGTEIARGGRYNDIGRAFGRARPATGFSADLKTLVRHGEASERSDSDAILAPWSDDAALLTLVEKLKASGRRVIWELPEQTGGMDAMGCKAVIRYTGSEWVIE